MAAMDSPRRWCEDRLFGGDHLGESLPHELDWPRPGGVLAQSPVSALEQGSFLYPNPNPNPNPNMNPNLNLGEEQVHQGRPGAKPVALRSLP